MADGMVVEFTEDEANGLVDLILAGATARKMLKMEMPEGAVPGLTKLLMGLGVERGVGGNFHKPEAGEVIPIEGDPRKLSTDELEKLRDGS
jgi:hypothetical protein